MSSLAQLTEQEVVELCDAALKARDGSYSPYSHFRVGAAAYAQPAAASEEWTLWTGANIENASFGGTICAERTLLVKAASEGHRRFKAIAIASDVADVTTTPCGICRQFIREFVPLPQTDLLIYIVPSDLQVDVKAQTKSPGKSGKDVWQTSLSYLLPHSFGPSNLS